MDCQEGPAHLLTLALMVKQGDGYWMLGVKSIVKDGDEVTRYVCGREQKIGKARLLPDGTVKIQLYRAFTPKN